MERLSGTSPNPVSKPVSRLVELFILGIRFLRWRDGMGWSGSVGLPRRLWFMFCRVRFQNTLSERDQPLIFCSNKVRTPILTAPSGENRGAPPSQG